MKIGDNVTVNDQKPAAHGVIVDIKPWSEVLNFGSDIGTAVQVLCEEWQNTSRWIDEYFIEPEHSSN